MSQPPGKIDAFLSHASEDGPLARRLERSLQSRDIAVWVDHANLRGGSVLLKALEDALEASTNLVTLWSNSASESDYVEAEWHAAYYMKKGIIPCLLDDTPLPPFLMGHLYCDFRASYETGLAELLRSLTSGSVAPPQPYSQLLAMARDTLAMAEQLQEIVQIDTAQKQILMQLQAGNAKLAATLQAELDSRVDTVVRANPADPLALSLAGYHKKNAYLIRHWEALQAGLAPWDPLLDEAQRLFFRALSIQPDDPSAQNGLGSVLIAKRDLDGAEFYVRRALALTSEAGIPYPEAEHDLQVIQRLKEARPKP